MTNREIDALAQLSGGMLATGYSAAEWARIGRLIAACDRLASKQPRCVLVDLRIATMAWSSGRPWRGGGQTKERA